MATDNPTRADNMPTLAEWQQTMRQECLASANLPSQLPSCVPIYGKYFQISNKKPIGFKATWFQHTFDEFQSKYSHPEPDKVTGKIAKYKTPFGAEPAVFLPAVHQEVWARIADRQGLNINEIWNWGAENGHGTAPYRTPQPYQKISFFWEWAAQSKLPIYITEGCKKANSLMASGFLATAVAGVYNGHIVTKSGQKKTGVQLVSNLQPLIYQGRKVVLVFDADVKAETRANVSRALKEFAGALTDAGASVSRIEWNQADYAGAKGVDDLIASAGIEALTALKPARLAGSFKTAVKAQRMDQVAAWKNKQDAPAHEWNKVQLLPPAVPTMAGKGLYIDPTQGDLFAAKVVAGKGRLHIISAPMGAGKTSAVCKSVISKWRAEHRNRKDGIIIYLAPRLTILSQAAIALNIAKHEALKVPGIREVAVTVESLHAYQPLWTNTDAPVLVIADEWSQALAQLHNGVTGTQSTSEQIATLQSLFKAVSERGSFLISEDIVTNYDASYTGLPIGEYFLFNREVPSRNFNFVRSKNEIAATIVEALQNGDAVCHVSDSNRQCRGLEMLLVTEGLLKPEQILVIDSQAVPSVREEFMRNPMGYVTRNNIRFLACSPSAQSGVSLDDKEGHFATMTFSLTHLEFRSGRQLLGRLRSDVNAVGMVSDHGVVFQSKGGRLKSLALPQNLMDQAVEDLNAVFNLCGSPTLEMVEKLKATLASVNAGHLKAATNRLIASSQAISNYGQHDLKKKIAQDLEAKGHTVTNQKVTVDASIVSAMRAIFGLVEDEQTEIDGTLSEAEAEVRADLDVAGISISEAAKIRKAADATHLDRLKANKVMDIHYFPTLAAAGRFDCADGQLALKRDRFLSKTELLHLATNPAQLSTSARNAIMIAFTDTDDNLDQFTVELFKLKKDARKAYLLSATGILDIIEKGEGFLWSEADPNDLVEMVKARALGLAGPILSQLRLNVTEEQSASEITNKLLRKLGFKIKFTRPKGEGPTSTRPRVYYVSDFDNNDRAMALQDYADQAARDGFRFASGEAKRFICDAIKAHIRDQGLPHLISVNEDKQLVSAVMYASVDQTQLWTTCSPFDFGPTAYDAYRDWMRSEEF